MLVVSTTKRPGCRASPDASLIFLIGFFLAVAAIIANVLFSKCDRSQEDVLGAGGSEDQGRCSRRTTSLYRPSDTSCTPMGYLGPKLNRVPWSETEQHLDDCAFCTRSTSRMRAERRATCRC
eukprot:SAG22_NODE_14_length_33165_cov_13.196698_38_plen_122_part_00